MNTLIRKTGLILIATFAMFISSVSIAGNCPVGLVSGMAIDDEFGLGSQDITRCLDNTKEVKVVYQVNKECKNSSCTKPYAIGNMNNAINDYKITHGMKDSKFKLVAIIHGGGWSLVLNNDAQNPNARTNPFQDQMTALLAKGVKVYFCQNTARSKGVKMEQMIPGIQFVTAGVTAIADLQLDGYAYVQP